MIPPSPGGGIAAAGLAAELQQLTVAEIRAEAETLGISLPGGNRTKTQLIQRFIKELS